MKILVAEDEPMLLKTIELKLKKEGYEVITIPQWKGSCCKNRRTGPWYGNHRYHDALCFGA